MVEGVVYALVAIASTSATTLTSTRDRGAKINSNTSKTQRLYTHACIKLIYDKFYLMHAPI